MSDQIPKTTEQKLWTFLAWWVGIAVGCLVLGVFFSFLAALSARFFSVLMSL